MYQFVFFEGIQLPSIPRQMAPPGVPPLKMKLAEVDRKNELNEKVQSKLNQLERLQYEITKQV